jgi:hypothetical protein
LDIEDEKVSGKFTAQRGRNRYVFGAQQLIAAAKAKAGMNIGLVVLSETYLSNVRYNTYKIRIKRMMMGFLCE